MKILLTGATGYIGTHFREKAVTCGHEVVAASRHPPPGDSPWILFDLKALDLSQVPCDTDLIVHLAANTTADEGIAETTEIEVADALIDVAHRIHARLVFISSQVAYAGAPTAYGRIKWQIERRVLKAGSLVIRLGLVYGGREMGLFGTLVRLVRVSPILPVFIPSPMVQPIHVDDCVAGILAVSELTNYERRVYVLASARPISITKFLSAIARHRVKKIRLFIPVPVLFIRLLIRGLSLISYTSFGLARLESLFVLPPVDTARDLNELGLKLRTLSAGMLVSDHNRRRLLLEEGLGLLTYVLRTQPRGVLVRRYARMIETMRDGQLAGWRGWVYRSPILLACLERIQSGVHPVADDLRWRIGAATLIAEASVQGFDRFLAMGKRTRVPIAIFMVGRVVVAEVFILLLTPLLAPLLWLIGRQRNST
ncbi:NAD-dependent epimerase/dehydratase family protein [Candidatus Thiosymbion oneisti]|uniref:NAD-dependent epimerase/dehydratase family protein n=1 Tax=Candidatus Thiosymbion oneisti TaxID=589554 RepID=UPI0013FD364F|nr:sugar nucleotide-binding protein [Candidatus Thiosymbion oneisti]